MAYMWFTSGSFSRKIGLPGCYMGQIYVNVKLWHYYIGFHKYGPWFTCSYFLNIFFNDSCVSCSCERTFGGIRTSNRPIKVARAINWQLRIHGTVKWRINSRSAHACLEITWQTYLIYWNEIFVLKEIIAQLWLLLSNSWKRKKYKHLILFIIVPRMIILIKVKAFINIMIIEQRLLNMTVMPRSHLHVETLPVRAT